jgi:fumarylacetoacetate (FAA) hydrolase
VILVRKARNAQPPATLETDPLIYQGGSGDMIGPRDPIELHDPAWGLDYESEVCVVLGDTPIGTRAASAERCIRLVMLANDWTLRNLIPDELAKGFGFFQSKPATAFSPVAVTPDELGGAWDGTKVHLPVTVHINGALFGQPDAGEDMTFDFPQLIAHAARTRTLAAGSIIGSGTISNVDRSRGSACLAEKRTLEMLETGKAVTPFLRFGDRLRIEMFDAQHRSVFGAIDQEVQRYLPPE